MSNKKATYSLTTTELTELKDDLLILGHFEDDFTYEGKLLDQALNGALTNLMESGDLSGKSGTLLPLFKLEGMATKWVLIVGLGKREKFSLSTLKKGVTTATNWAKAQKLSSATFAMVSQCKKRENSFPALMQAVGASLYQYDAYKSEKSPEVSLNSVNFYTENSDELTPLFNYGKALIEGMDFTRNLGNAPANKMTPTILAEEAEALAAEESSIKCTILKKSEIEALGMGSFLGVAQGSVEEPRFIVLEYSNHSNSDEKPVVLVGKGVTFDTGGISLKPGAAMDEMKFDMCGAASVLGTFKAVAQLGMKINLVGLIPATENMPAGDALKPGDVITSMSGQTIEVLNTDAEGRLILCDALTYATQYEPKAIVDIATLTGAIIMALGYDVSGLFSNDEALAQKLSESAERTDDKVWQFPIWEETYQSLLDSNFADMANIGAGRGAGSITAACFLERFVKEYPWAHLDIAGTAWVTGKEKGASGRPVPLLLNFLKQYEA